jgi:hypothetical protein
MSPITRYHLKVFLWSCLVLYNQRETEGLLPGSSFFPVTLRRHVSFSLHGCFISLAWTLDQQRSLILSKGVPHDAAERHVIFNICQHVPAMVCHVTVIQQFWGVRGCDRKSWCTDRNSVSLLISAICYWANQFSHPNNIWWYKIISRVCRLWQDRPYL